MHTKRVCVRRKRVACRTMPRACLHRPSPRPTQRSPASRAGGRWIRRRHWVGVLWPPHPVPHLPRRANHATHTHSKSPWRICRPSSARRRSPPLLHTHTLHPQLPPLCHPARPHQAVPPPRAAMKHATHFNTHCNTHCNTHTITRTATHTRQHVQKGRHTMRRCLARQYTHMHTHTHTLSRRRAPAPRTMATARRTRMRKPDSALHLLW
mmetsp:Transcript_28659/g.46091  ORF Transcript_28659/g.46091 Transcript_28659/m.46091 type:complete len:209 (-) Transcript_28659:228-854(-)